MNGLVWFWVTGVPSPQGSKRGYAIPGKEGARPRAVVVDGSSKAGKEKLRTWRQDVIDASTRHIERCEEANGGAWLPLAGPLRLSIEFVLPRPKTVPKERRGWPATKPDMGKLTRATEDALKLGRIYKDDSLICLHEIEKRYAGPDGWTGATIVVEELEQA